MLKLSLIASYEPQHLPEVLAGFMADRSELSKSLTLFLDENTFKMGENTETPIWRQYKSMGDAYELLTHKINVTQFYINK
jgi:hypothetical protein